MEKMILVDIETMDFDVNSGIYEVALLVVEHGEIVKEVHLAEEKDPSLIHLGMGQGYANISKEQDKIDSFRNILNEYKYPMIAHNVAFDRKFLTHYGWLDEDYECYDSTRAIKYANPNLFSYSLDYLVSFYELAHPLNHTAIEDVRILFEVINHAAPTTWIPLYKAKPKQLTHLVESIATVEGESNIFKDKTIVFTGASTYPRALMKEIGGKCGAKVSGSISSKTDYLICGEKPGSKLQKARELDVEIKTDVWFLDAVSKELNLNKVSIKRNRIPIQNSSSGKPVSPFKKLDDLKGKNVNIACMPRRVQSKLENILMNHMEVGKLNKGSNGYKVDLIIYADGGEYVLLEKAKQLNIQTIALSKFNKMIL